MLPQTRSRLAALTAVIGVILMIAGIATGKSGAVVVGLCVAVAGIQQISAARRKQQQ